LAIKARVKDKTKMGAGASSQRSNKAGSSDPGPRAKKVDINGKPLDASDIKVNLFASNFID